MFYRADIELKTDFELTLNMSSLFQGVMMEQLAACGHAAYAQKLHESGLHPYTQHLERHEGVWHWVLTFLNEEARDLIWRDSLCALKALELKDKKQTLPLGRITEDRLSESELNEIFKTGTEIYGIGLTFLTPTAFKSNGRYVFMPDLQFILRSAMQKYDAAIPGEKLFDLKTLDELLGEAIIQSFNLRSQFLSIEGIKIPGFTGRMTVRCPRSRTMTAFLAMLLTFSGYSGIGIKTGMGMGAVRTELIPFKAKGGERHE